MKGDFSRFSFDAARAVRTVTIQQGRVVTDADLMEAGEATLRRLETETIDTLGACAAPSVGGGFQIIPPAGANPMKISAGRLYVDGLLVENPGDAALPAPPGAGRWLVYLKVVVDHVTGVEMPVLRDAALGDADTAGRSIIRTEIGYLAAGATDGCATPNASFAAMSAPSGGAMSVATVAGASSKDPCRLTPDGGYARPENLLYRLEVDGGVAVAGQADRFDLNGLKIKISRNNASEIAEIADVTGARITLKSSSKDGMPIFQADQYAELLGAGPPYDAEASGPLTLIQAVQGDVLVLASAAGAVKGGRVRLWSQDLVSLGAGAKITLDGLEFTFSGKNFRKGDYWIAPARYATADIDASVPKNTPRPPAGPRKAYAKLGMFTVGGGGVDPKSIVDCRAIFTPLIYVTELEYAGGDGQSIAPPTGPGAQPVTQALPASLRAIARIGGRVAAGRRVQFRIVSPAPAAGVLKSGGTAGPDIIVETDPDGLARVDWLLSANPLHKNQQVAATLLVDPLPGYVQPPPLIYSASLDLASGVAYQPSKCVALSGQTDVQGALDKLCADIAALTAEQISYKSGACKGLDNVANVQEALDKLCNDLLELRRADFLVPVQVTLVNTGKPIDNNQEVTFADLAGGFVVEFSDPIKTKAAGNEPIARLTVDMPFPMGSTLQTEWRLRMTGQNRGALPIVGTMPIHLSGNFEINERILKWTPTPNASTFLQRSFLTLGLTPSPPSEPAPVPQGDRVDFQEKGIRAYITVRGDSIWSIDPQRRRRYLNGELLRFSAAGNLFSIFPPADTDINKRIAFIRDICDPQAAADFNLWFYLVNRNV